MPDQVYTKFILYFYSIIPIYSAAPSNCKDTICLNQRTVFLLTETSHSLLLGLSYNRCPYRAVEGRRWKDQTSLLEQLVTVGPKRISKKEW